MKRLDLYILTQVVVVTTVVGCVLTGVMLMTQSLRFLDLIITSGASGLAFITLSLLALPRFFEVIAPLATVTGVIFAYIKLRQDAELTIMRNAGMSPLRLARPALACGAALAVLMFLTLGWVAPHTLAKMQELRQVLRVQYSAAIFREGVFNSLGNNVTIYVGRRLEGGGLDGLMIHDARPENKSPVTITARAGQILMTKTGQQVLVFNGVRQSRNPGTQAIERLQFERYMVDLPDPDPVSKRWAEPEERTLTGLLSTDLDASDIAPYTHEFRAEIHRRFLSPLLSLSFTAMGLALILLAPYRRTSSTVDIGLAALSVIVCQSLYIGAFSIAKDGAIGIILMYALAFGPAIAGLGFLARASVREGTNKTPSSPSPSVPEAP